MNFKNLVEFMLKSAIVIIFLMVGLSHVISNLQIQHVNSSGMVIDSYNIIKCYHVLDFTR